MQGQPGIPETSGTSTSPHAVLPHIILYCSCHTVFYTVVSTHQHMSRQILDRPPSQWESNAGLCVTLDEFQWVETRRVMARLAPFDISHSKSCQTSCTSCFPTYAGVPSRGAARPEIDMAGCPSLIATGTNPSHTTVKGITLANLPSGPPTQLPYSVWTGLAWSFAFGRYGTVLVAHWVKRGILEVSSLNVCRNQGALPGYNTVQV
jgi:hypothetical protein